MSSSITCEHANEVPARCPCPATCPCRSNTCKPGEGRLQSFLARGLATAVGAAIAGWALPALDIVNALRTLHGRPRVTSIAEHDAEVAAARAARRPGA